MNADVFIPSRKPLVDMSYGMQQAVSFAKSQIAKGEALNWSICGGVLSVESDQGWSVWYDPAEDDFNGNSDTCPSDY